ncbi:glycoside hydrolase family 15 protein [Streptomyces sp. NPDC047987]|uniref:glycoside hydrolase family 15 protein n=1 Tax=unclassified Streptomyces TaxID=2593676 RepID=UPI003423CA5D
MNSRPARIEDYALIGDMQTAALVCRDGSIDWHCLQRFDSTAVFSSLLGTEKHGFWRIGPATPTGVPAPYADRRCYRGDSLILETEWDTSTGTVRVIDFMPAQEEKTAQLVRIVEGVTGEVEMTSAMSARFGYGQHTPWIYDDRGRTAVVCGPDSLWLDTAVPGIEKDGTVRHAFTARAGEWVVFTLSWQPSHAPAPDVPNAEAALAKTAGFWQEWAGQLTYDGPYREQVTRALITLKALIYATTGAVIAAPTTSLPEDLGGGRNWDYRYTWLRDASLTLSALLRAGFRQEAEAWQQWLLRTLGGAPEKFQIMYGVAGERDLPERELDWLPGYEGSAPVRVGNGAAGQRQLDVPGEVIETLYVAHQHGLARCDSTAALHLRLVDYIQKHWREPDDGIWEVRGGQRHFVHSKVMAWVAVDRTIRLTDAGVLSMPPADRARLVELRDEIHTEVCDKGFDAARNTFTQSYGSQEVDASLLLIPRTGFLPPDDPRVVGTVAAVRRELATPEGLVHRYPTASGREGLDGLRGDEGAFLLCSFWLVNDLALAGQVDDAVELFERLLALTNDVGLLAEEYDPVSGRQLGNFPQAFSMLGLVDSAVLLGELTRAVEPVMAA